MPNPYPTELRERAVRAYETGAATYEAVAERFSVSVWTLLRWVDRWRATGCVTPRDKAGGWTSPVELAAMHAVVREMPAGTTHELTQAYNRRVSRAHRVHRSSFLRALQRAGYVFKKNVRGPQSTTGRTSGRSAKPTASGPPR
jgi:transposase